MPTCKSNSFMLTFLKFKKLFNYWQLSGVNANKIWKKMPFVFSFVALILNFLQLSLGIVRNTKFYGFLMCELGI